MSDAAPEIVEHPAERGAAAPDPAGATARAEATRRLERDAPRAAALRAAHRRLGTLRLLVFFVGVALAIWLFKEHPVHAPLAAVPLLVFAGLVLRHEKVATRRAEAEAAVAWHERTLARLDGRWQGVGPTGEEFAAPGHLYAHDLDVVGPGSLFQLLVPPTTRLGQRTLASWLLDPAPVDEVRARQEAVAELTPDVDLRQDLGCLDATVTEHLDDEALRAWAADEPVVFATWERVLARVMALLAAVALGGWAVGLLPFGALGTVMILESLPAAFAVRRVLLVTSRSDEVAGALKALGRVLRPLEERAPQSARLAALRERLDVGELPPSTILEGVDRRIESLQNGQRGSVYAFTAYLFQRHVILAHEVEQRRQELADRVADWVAVAGELQALAALSGHAYEHADHVFPELDEGPARFEAEGLGHPLLPATVCVRNDVSMTAERPLFVVSGSNMSGKSTWLRSLGLAAVMAQAGAPVRAHACGLTPLGVATSLRIADDLQAGSSHFDAEVRRLAAIDQAAGGARPLLVLLDEILHGTNSADRFAGARAVVGRLLEQGALGLVTTHDLALARLADEHGERVRNVHFEDTVTDGRMTFDYSVREGVVQGSNALALMRARGLPV